MGDWETYRLEVFKRSYENANTAVFWDMHDCQVPDCLNAVKVSGNIRSALAKLNYRGPTDIYAYGDIRQIIGLGLESENTTVEYHEAAESRLDRVIMDYKQTASILVNNTPVMVVNQTPAGSRDARLEMILVDLLAWAIRHPSPSNLVLILGDISEHMEFVVASTRLGMESHNVIFAMPGNTTAPLVLPLETTLQWESLSYGQIIRDKIHVDRSQGGSQRGNRSNTNTGSLDNTCVVSGRNRWFLLGGVFVCVVSALLRSRYISV